MATDNRNPQPPVFGAPIPASTGVGDYVAEMQLHMTLQSRNLLPSLGQPLGGGREQLLREAQESVEKLLSRQTQ
jgi:hypothetical protein